jgi:uncharacterized membrane protein
MRDALRFTLGEKGALAWLLGGFLILGAYYALDNPLCKPDEAFHYAYAFHLRSGHGLPVIRVIPGRTQFTPVEMEAHQPPLYYAGVAGIAALLNLRERIVPSVNPYLLGTLEGNRCLTVPLYSTFSESPIFFTGRLVSLVCGAMALLFAYLLCRVFLPWPVALLSVAFMGFNPQYLFIATSFSNDMPVTALVHLGLWQLGRAIRAGLHRKRALILGGIIAGATLTKLTGLGLLIPLGGIALWQAWRTRGGRPLLNAGLAALVVAVGGSWWFWRNGRLYGSPFATHLLTVLLGRRSSPWTLEDLRDFLAYVWRSYWLAFSPGGLLFAEPPVYVGISLICLLALFGLIRALRRNKSIRPLFALIWGWFLLVFLSFLHLTQSTPLFIGGGRLLFPAAIALGATLAVGLTQLFHRFPFVPAGLAILLAIYAAAAPIRYIHPAYPRPHRVQTLEHPPRYPLGISFGDGYFELIGYDLQLTQVAGRSALAITYYWRTLRETSHNFSVFIHLQTQREGQIALLTQVDTYPGYGSYPTSAWRRDWIFIDRLALPLPPPGSVFSGTIVTGLYDLPTMERLPAYDREGRRFPNDAVPLAELWTDSTGALHLLAPVDAEGQR